MASVTYKNQPGIHKTRGAVPLDGTAHLYTVNKVLWHTEIEEWISQRLINPTLHVCCGKSQLGDVRLDLFESDVDVLADAARLPFVDGAFSTVLIDPPYNGKFQWNHDMLNELHRVASQRIIFQHWYSPVNKDGKFKKAHVFMLADTALVPYNAEPENIVPAFRDADGNYFIINEDETDGKVFNLSNLAYWQPRSYFGRAQIISVMDRISDEL